MLQVIDFGAKVDMLTKDELAEALAEDARLRAVVTGVKAGELWLNTSSLQGQGTVVATLGGGSPQAPAQGFVWAVMNIGLELATSSQVRVYKGVPSHYAVGAVAPDGSGRLVTTMQSFITPSAQFSKGQLTMKAADYLTLVAVTGGSNILSVFLSYIEVPAERQGELWL